ncbi:GNAT family N-acetyltransferase [Actinotalea fermentans]|uniref:N-acetyltransferase domain-containing protein n=1 Tax=Actinotalea fermentans TaxID=43671 RepID=A0A511YZA8_9CELL|nr:GNAT family N-acetyltransferase [Actinotalea fermentans]KGM15312.1 hypothetical protein N867_09880 [Actinotalea fermentans ATCC 43279 = JCM 9966 = DSM 3133]GEN80530.1 hypothetical protein AFE02nite_22640 [Actinotalea fermentans]
MSIDLRTPDVADLAGVVGELATWQSDRAGLQLHPGDVGWYSTRGADATAAALRTWSRDGRLLAMGLLDGPSLLRLAVAPDVADDDGLADRIAADLADPRGVMGAGSASVEARGARRLSAVLAEHGWRPGELWTPFRRDLSAPVGDLPVRVETVDADRAAVWAAIHWSAFRGTEPSSDELRRVVDRWRTMAEGPLSAAARTVVALDRDGDGMAVATVWSAGPGRPGLIEPMGVHRDHRGHGYGTGVSVAAAAVLREMGASSAVVCAESSNVGAVATYAAAGFTAGPQVADLERAG